MDLHYFVEPKKIFIWQPMNLYNEVNGIKYAITDSETI